MRILITGGCGFIGSHLAEALQRRGDSVVAYDSFDDYYDPAVKRRTAAELTSAGIEVIEGDVRDPSALEGALASGGVERVVHLAARPGVRASIERPEVSLDINVRGTRSLLEAMRLGQVQGLVFASSSSVYGGDSQAPFREAAPASRPLSPYAASKRAGEMLVASYAEVFGLDALALRFFTVYGPRGRPDMAIGKFVARGLKGQAVPLYGDGSVVRDFTYVDDIVAGVMAAVDHLQPGSGRYQCVNIGGGKTATMAELIELIGEALGQPLVLDRRPAAQGDMPLTHADLTLARQVLGFESKVGLAEGVARTVAWARAQGE